MTINLAIDPRLNMLLGADTRTSNVFLKSIVILHGRFAPHATRGNSRDSRRAVSMKYSQIVRFVLCNVHEACYRTAIDVLNTTFLLPIHDSLCSYDAVGISPVCRKNAVSFHLTACLHTRIQLTSSLETTHNYT